MKKPKIKKIKKIKRSTMVNKLDRLFSLKVREAGYCELEGKDHVKCGGVLQCAHIVTRSRKVLRWDFMNALCICAGHHVYYTHNPNEWRDIIYRRFPVKEKYVSYHAHETWDKDLEAVKKRLEEL